MSTFESEEARSPLGGDWAAMTFPLFRPLLSLLGAGQASPSGTWPVARLARQDGRPAGLALAEISASDPSTAELLSLLVVSEARGRGLATALVAALEQDLARRGVAEISGVYMSGKAFTPALERVFARRGFSAPQVRKIVVQCTPEEAARTDWFQKARLPEGGLVFPWAELPREEYDQLRRSQAERPWIPQILEPWSCGEHVDAASSFGLRLYGEVAGWVLTHRVAPLLVRYTACFVREDLQAQGALFPVLVASIERLMGTGATCTFVTSSQFPRMVRFTQRRLAPFVSYSGETRGVTKRLDAAPPAEGA